MEIPIVLVSSKCSFTRVSIQKQYDHVLKSKLGIFVAIIQHVGPHASIMKCSLCAESLFYDKYSDIAAVRSSVTNRLGHEILKPENVKQKKSRVKFEV